MVTYRLRDNLTAHFQKDPISKNISAKLVGALIFLIAISSFITSAQATISIGSPNGNNVYQIKHDDGRFVYQGHARWNELNKSNLIVNSFVESKRSNSSVFLRDMRRGIELEINLKTNKVIYRDQFDFEKTLYKIDRSYMGAYFENDGYDPKNAIVKVSADYQCHNGQALSVEFDKVNNQQFVTWFFGHNAGNHMPLVDASSGEQYSDGHNTILVNGNDAAIWIGDQQNSCRRISSK